MLATYNISSEGIGNAAQVAFPFTFKITDLAHLLVVITNGSGVETSRVRGTDLVVINTVTFDPIAGGGTVTLVAAPANGARVLMLLANDLPKQPSEFKNKFDFKLERIEAAYDYIASALQRVSYFGQRSVKLHDLDDPSTFNPTFPQGVASNALNLIPSVTSGGWAPVSTWTPVVDLLTAVASAAAAAASAAAALVSQLAAAASAVAAAASAAAALVSETNAAASAAAAAASVVAGAGSPDVVNSVATPDPISGSVNFGQSVPSYVDWRTFWWIRGATNGEVLTGVTAGLHPGHELILLIPPAVNAVVLPSTATNVNLNGDWHGDPDCALCMMWNGTNWFELWRR